MRRRDFLKLAGLGFLSLFIPEIGTEMELEDIWEKIANNARLTREELSFLKQSARETQLRNSFVAGNTTAQNTLNVKFPIETIFSQKLHKDLPSLTVQIPPDYSHLLMMGSFRTDRATYEDSIIVQYNGDTGTNYRTQFDVAQNAATSALQVTAQDEAGISLAPGASASANEVGNFFLFLVDYNSTWWKSTLRVTGMPTWSATDMLLLNAVDFYESTAPIRSAKFFPQNGTNILAGSILTILGIR